jgi:biofilm PGA synthesis N-glycosyltransferase PgaC
MSAVLTDPVARDATTNASSLSPTTLQPQATTAQGSTALAERPYVESASRPAPGHQPRKGSLTVLIPAYNEAENIAETIQSLHAQTIKPDHIIVVDDCSKDNTGEIARAHGATVVRPSKNRGCKASALNYGLDFVPDELCLAIDADTTLAPDAIEKLLPAMSDERFGAACGFVLPRRVQTMWERGRYVEYLYAFEFYKPIQDYYGRPMIASGCFSVYRTADLRRIGGWPTRTVGEDMDLTWTLYNDGYKVRYVPEAICYPIEPPTFAFMQKQLMRWSSGFWQCVKVHWKDLLNVPYLRMIVAVALWDAVFAATIYFTLLPLLAIFVHPLFLLGYLMDLPSIAGPVLYGAYKRGETLKALSSIPAFYVLRFVNFYYSLKTFYMEFIARKPLRTFEKGH